MYELRTRVAESAELRPLRVAAMELQSRLKHLRAFVKNSEAENFLCPVCQEGLLNRRTRGKLLGLIDDVWLVCGKCDARLDRRLENATLVSATLDPHGTFAKFGGKLLSLASWREIAYAHSRKSLADTEEAFATILGRLRIAFLHYFEDGTIAPILANVSAFVLKVREQPALAIHAEIVERRKRKVTRRVTTGGSERRFASVSVRVAKGLWFHTGASAPSSPRQTYVETNETEEAYIADEGELLVTNQRITFKGQRSRGFAVPLSKVAAIDSDPDSRCIILVPEGKKPVVFRVPASIDVVIGEEELVLPIALETEWIAAQIGKALSADSRAARLTADR